MNRASGGLQARAVLMGQWGFGKNGDLAGTVCLFTGEPGTGKTLAAEAVGFETGKPLKVTSQWLASWCQACAAS